MQVGIYIYIYVRMYAYIRIYTDVCSLQLKFGLGR